MTNWLNLTKLRSWFFKKQSVRDSDREEPRPASRLLSLSSTSFFIVSADAVIAVTDPAGEGTHPATQHQKFIGKRFAMHHWRIPFYSMSRFESWTRYKKAKPVSWFLILVILTKVFLTYRARVNVACFRAKGGWNGHCGGLGSVASKNGLKRAKL